jgi:hypothetical protein
VLAATVECELETDLRLLGVPLDSSCARHASLYQVVRDRTNIAWRGIQRQSFAFSLR